MNSSLSKVITDLDQTQTDINNLATTAETNILSYIDEIENSVQTFAELIDVQTGQVTRHDRIHTL